MKTQILYALLGSSTLLGNDLSRAPIYEETFNITHSRVDYRNGAGLGGPGTGVSGKLGDRCYRAVPSTTENQASGPAGLAIAPITPNPLSAFTCTFWYYLDEEGPELQVPLSTAGIAFFLNNNNFEVRIDHQVEHPRLYTFPLGLRGPLVGWRDTAQWIFATISWEQSTNTLIVHQGTPLASVTFVRDMKRALPANPTLPRSDLAQNPEVIGNNPRNLDRPLAGRMDNLRFFDRVLPIFELEAIRRSDVANEAPKF